MPDNNPAAILDTPSARKPRSGATPLDRLENPQPEFGLLLDKFYGGHYDACTLERLVDVRCWVGGASRCPPPNRLDPDFPLTVWSRSRVETSTHLAIGEASFTWCPGWPKIDVVALTTSPEKISEADEGQLLLRYLDGGDLAAREDLAVRLYKHAYTTAARLAPALGLRWGNEDFEDFAQNRMLDLFRDEAKMLRNLRHKTTGGVIGMTLLLSRCRMLDARRRVGEKARERTSSMDEELAADEALSLHDILADASDTAATKVLREELVLAVRRAKAVTATSPDRRRVLDLWCQGMKYRDIAILLDLPEGTVCTHVNRGIAEIAAQLAKEGFHK